MTSISQFLGSSSAGGGRPYYQRRVRVSETFIVPFDGLLDILALAGHGSGSVCGWANTSANYPKFTANGASAGEAGAKFSIAVKKNDVFTITIGAGGAAASVATMTLGGNFANGNDGSDTTVVCAARGISITVKSGKGATVTQSASGVVPASVSANPGGTGGSGCDMLAQGGFGGAAVSSLSSTTAANQFFIIGGPGAPNLFFQDPASCSGGTATASGTASARVLGGPGAPNGKGGNAIASGQANGNVCTGGCAAGGGNGGDASGINATGVHAPNYLGNPGETPFYGGLMYINFGLDLYAGTLTAVALDVSRYSGGSTNIASSYSALPQFSCASTVFGGAALTLPAGNSAPSGNLYVFNTSSTSLAGPFASGKGGDGLVVLNLRSA